MTDDTVLVYFYVSSLDVGQYKTGMFAPASFQRVAVSMPAKEQYIANWVDWNTSDRIFDVVLSMAGLHYCYRELHDACTIDPAFQSSNYQDDSKSEDWIRYDPEMKDDDFTLTNDDDENWNG